VAQVRRDLRHRAQHVGPAHEVRPRQRQAGARADQLAEQQDVEVHAARRPLRRIALAAAQALDALQLCDDRVDVERRVEAGHEVDEIRAVEAHGAVLPRGRERDRREAAG
jgi:hypothetical protein